MPQLYLGGMVLFLGLVQVDGQSFAPSESPLEGAGHLRGRELQATTGDFLIKNAKSGFYLVAGSWGTDGNDRKVFQFSEHLRMNNWDGFVWRLHADGRIQNVRSGMYLLAGSWGFNPHDTYVWQYPLHQAAHGRDGFEWEVMLDGKIRNRKSSMYLLAGSWGHNLNDQKVWQYPLHHQANGLDGFLWELSPFGGCGTMTKLGGWVPSGFYQYAAGVSTAISVGWTETTTHTQERDWQTSVGAAIETGFSATVGEPDVASATSSITITFSASYAWGGAESLEESTSRNAAEVTTINPRRSGTIWQYKFVASDRCGSGKLLTNTMVITENNELQPCCPPGGFVDADNVTGPCVKKEICQCEPTLCELLHTQCVDKNPVCPQWADYCEHWFWRTWMHGNCKNTCNICSSDGSASSR